MAGLLFGFCLVFGRCWLWCEGFFLHKHVGLAGCGCEACRCELVVESPFTVFRFDGLLGGCFRRRFRALKSSSF